MSPLALSIDFNEAKIDRIFAGVNRGHVPGAAVGIAIDGKPVYRKGFGLANAELPVTLSPTIRMRLYSVTKHLTCFAFLLLCEEGRASVQDSIGKYFPELHPVVGSITPLHLMSNTSGLRDATDIAWVLGGQGDSLTTKDVVSVYRTMGEVVFAPDTSWNYNNGGFVLLSLLIEKVSGQSLEEMFRQRIFEPIGMYDTLLRRTNKDFLPNSASTHMPNSTGFDKSEYSGERAGENGVMSTIDDMLRWLAHMEEPVIGNAETWAYMKTPRRLENGTLTDYGSGLFIQKYRGTNVVHHGGGGVNGNAWMLKVPDAKLDIVVLTNRGDVSSWELAASIIDSILPDLDPARERRTDAIGNGVFCSPKTGRVVQLFAENGEQRAWIDNYNFLMSMDDDGCLRSFQPFPLRQSLAIHGTGDVMEVVLDDYGNEDVLLKVEGIVSLPAATLLGRYTADCGEIEATIYQTDDGIEMRTASPLGSNRFPLEFRGGRIWQAKSTLHFFSGIVSFNDPPNEFRFTTARSGALKFRRNG